MSNLTRRLRQRFGKLGRKPRTARKDARRFLQGAERLEERCLLAGDIAISPLHNPIIPADVNVDFEVSPLDALMVINHLNKYGSGPVSEVVSRAEAGQGEGESEPMGLIDVNGDGFISPLDALMVINSLNGEGQGEVLSFRLEVTNLNDEAISSIGAGQEFKLRSFVQDMRGFNATGVFSFYSDVEIANFDLVDLVVTETREIRLSRFTTGGNFSLTNSGTGQTVVVSLGTNLAAATTNIQSAMNTLYGEGNSRVLQRRAIEFQNDDPNEPVENPFNWDIKFIGDLLGAEVPAMSIDPANLQVSSGSPSGEVIVLGAANPVRAATEFNFGRTFDWINGPRGQIVSDPGPDAIIDDIGGFSKAQSMPLDVVSEELLFWEIVFTAQGAGEVTFQGAPPTPIAASDILFFGSSQQLQFTPEVIDFGSPVSLAIVTSVFAANDNFTVQEDSLASAASNRFDVLANDQLSVGTQKRLQSFQSTSAQGGTITRDDNGTPTDLTDDTLRYQPAPNFFGTDTFTYVLSNEFGDTSVGTVTVRVLAVNDPPITRPNTAEMEQGTTLTIAGSTVTANDDPGPPNESNQTLTVTNATTATGSVSVVGGNIVYTPPADFVGDATITYTVRDNGRDEVLQNGQVVEVDNFRTAQGTITVTVTEVFVRPRAVTDRPTVVEDSADNVIDVLANDQPNEGAQAILLSFTQPANGVVVLDDRGTPEDPTDDRLIYTPNPDFFGIDVFTYVMNDTLTVTDPDNAGVDSTGTVSVTVSEVNDPPIANPNTVTTAEDVVLTISGSTLTANDSPGPANESDQTLTVTAVTSPSAQGGTVQVVGGNVVYTPRQDFNGVDTFVYTVTDNGTTAGQPDPKSATATVTVTVTAVNDPPVPGPNQFTTDEDVARTIAIGDLLANDLPGPPTATDELATQTVAFVSVSSTSAQGGTVVRVGNNLIYTPAADFNGTDTFTYVITDDGVPPLTATGTVTMNVTPVNDPPRGPNDTATASKNQQLTISVATLLSTKTPGPPDEAGQTMTVTSVQATTTLGGTAVLSANGQSIIYTPPADVAGVVDTITYVITDDGVPPASASFTIAVEIKDFEPSRIAGVVYVDANDDGLVGELERRIAGVEVTLTSTDATNGPVSRTVITNARGEYAFENLAPGTYTVSAAQPEFFRDGKDTPGAQGDLNNGSVNDQFRIQIGAEGGVNAAGFNFGEVGLSSQHVSILELLASTPTSGGYAALDLSGQTLWVTHLNGFSTVQFSELVMNADRSQALLSVVDENANVWTALLDNTIDFNFREGDNGSVLVRFNGDFNPDNFQTVNRNSPPAQPAFPTYLDSVDQFFSQF